MNPANFDEPIFSATLVPHRSLGQRGFLILMAAIAGLWFATGVFFVVLGAWPVLGFVGLDFLGILVAFRLNYRSGRAYEEIEVSRASLVVRKVTPNGRAQELHFNPCWARLEVEGSKDEGLTRVAIRAGDRRFPVGAFLNPEDRESFAGVFGAALAEARR